MKSSLLITALFASAFCATSAAPAPAAPLQESRDLAGIADEQQHLLRQLQRLRRTMEGLIPRLEQEGRTRALELLRDGLRHLDERLAEAGSLTLEELMDNARDGVESGRAVQSIENQESIIAGLERLLSILLDRESLENIEDSLEQLKALRRDIEDLVTRESELQEATEELREDSANEAQRELEAELDRLAEAQRELLRQGEELGRRSGTLELEQIEQQLNELVERQRVDGAVLEAWWPKERERLSALAPKIEAARRAAARAARLRKAAESLRQAAESAGAATTPEELQSSTSGLDAGAEREERHERASGDESARRAAEALRKAAGALREAGLNQAAQNEAARELEAEAQALERAASAQEAEAADAREAALAAASEAERSSSEAENAASGVRAALERAVQAQGSDPAEAARATEAAQQTLEKTLEDQRMLGPVLSASQDDAARTAERLERALEGLPRQEPSEDEHIAEAQRGLSQAAEAMQRASRSARGEDASQASQAASEAEDALERAQSALEQLRGAQAAADSEGAAAESRQLAAQQAQLSQQASQAGSKASEGSMTPESERQVAEELGAASEAMQRAASEMESGRSASAASSQREALEAVQRAQEAARDGVRPSEPEDLQRAEELAAEQRDIQKELLDLATRNEERKGSKPMPSLSGAASSAGQASESLDSGELDRAESQEEEVQQQLEQALDDVEEEEEQYQQLRQEELLFRIAEELTTLLEGHREAMRQVREIDAGREIAQRPSRAQRLRLRRIAGDESLLGARSGEIADAIEAEQSIVFAELLREVQQDLTRIARDLGETGDYQTGTRVQALQEDVEEAIGWVLEALRREQQRQQQEQQQQGQQDQQGENRERLVPDTAELQLLRRLEVDTLDGLNHMRLLYPELDDPNIEPDPYVLEDILRLAERHERTSELFEQFRRRLGIPDEDDAPLPVGAPDEETGVEASDENQP